MLTIIISILFWCMPEKEGLAAGAIALSILGIIVDMLFAGWLCIIDIIFLIINVAVYACKGDKK